MSSSNSPGSRSAPTLAALTRRRSSARCTELRPGNVNVTGTMGRAHINGALLRLMLGDAAAGTRPAGAFVSPSFNLSLLLENPARPGARSTLTVHGVKLDGWSYSMPEDDFIMEQVSFKALWISVQDETPS